MVINAVDGYLFNMPEAWLTGSVTCLYDDSTGVMTFYQIEHPENVTMLGAALLRISRFNKEEWESLAGTENYSVVCEQGNVVFAAALPSPDEELSISLEEVTQHLVPITE